MSTYRPLKSAHMPALTYAVKRQQTRLTSPYYSSSHLTLGLKSIATSFLKKGHIFKAQGGLKHRILIIGTGDIAKRYLCQWHNRGITYAVVRSQEKKHELRALGCKPLFANLDERASLKRLAGIANTVLYLAPPSTNNEGEEDKRLKRVLAVIESKQTPHCCNRFIYVSTTGVYGQHHGRWIDETTPCQAKTIRAKRRQNAEQQVRQWGRKKSQKPSHIQHEKSTPHRNLCTQLSRSAVILRVPGIYAIPDRLPLNRLKQGLPILNEAEDIYTNHIHADDLATILFLSIWRGRASRCYNACDHSAIKMGMWFELIAKKFQITVPQRADKETVRACLNDMQWSFLEESRRIRNNRVVSELRAQLKYPTVFDALTL